MSGTVNNSSSPNQQYSVVLLSDKDPSLLEVLHTFFAAAWRRRHVIVVPLLVLPVLGFGIGKFAPRTYETKMTLLAQDSGKQNPAINDLSIGSNLKDRMDSLKEVLMSHRILLDVAIDLGMISKDAPQDAQDNIVRALQGSIQIRLIGTDLIEFTYKSGNPNGMAKVLARVGQRFVERIMAPEDTSTNESVKFLEQQVHEQEDALDKVDIALADYKAKNAQMLPDQRQNNLTRLASDRDKLNEHEIALAGLESEFKSLRSRLLQTDPVIGHLEQDIVAKSAELAQLRARYTDSHSAVIAAQRQLDSLNDERNRLITESQHAAPVDVDRLWNMVISTSNAKDGDNKETLLVSQVANMEGLKTRLEQMRTETESLRTSVANLESLIASSGEVEKKVREYERDIKNKSEALELLRHRYSTATTASALSKFQAPERIKIVDSPVDPDAPTKPITLIFLLTGIAGGIVSGISVATFLEMLDPSIRRKREMEKLLGVPVFDRIPPLPQS